MQSSLPQRCHPCSYTDGIKAPKRRRSLTPYCCCCSVPGGWPCQTTESAQLPRSATSMACSSESGPSGYMTRSCSTASWTCWRCAAPAYPAHGCMLPVLGIFTAVQKLPTACLGSLQIRFNELYEVVDYFVLVECRVTHQNRPKPLYYQDNLERFSRFRSKVIHIALDSLEGYSSYYRSGCCYLRCAAPALLKHAHAKSNSTVAQVAVVQGVGPSGAPVQGVLKLPPERLQHARGILGRCCMRFA